MRLHLSLILVLATAVAACSQNGGTAASPGAPATVGPTRIEIRLTDALAIEPARIEVAARTPVTFVVTNAGATDHEFYLGDEDAQAEHGEEMKAGGMAHDELAGITVPPGQTKELRYTFTEAGETLAGCHVNDHYAAGMKAAIAVTG